ncbi:hypothetical protein JTE90_014519 [Oedothorax gibbosus]|uniref:Uncharacterized protein n=1 Tax=Oedothorax gibbosus TaxID=931172 RepID=A0AAV6VLQ1_9ARAC|nr:hypothetical protein JTE90_014519 [Oedothorax gibbosus]
MPHSEPVCITSAAKNEFFLEQQCSIEEQEEFHELEQFWDEEKQRLSDVDGQKPIANSWEERFLKDDVLSEPSPTKKSKGEVITVKGETAKDIPTSYVISGFEPHELIAIGTYVDKTITPGFRYKVRKNLTEDYLFDGQALHLENVGLGYGKRITFQGSSLNENENYFWSDSRIHGFGFTLQTLTTQEAFEITGQPGRLVIRNPALSPDTELNTVVKDNGRVEKLIRVNFSCDVVMKRGNIFMEDVEVQGLALVVRNGSSAMAKIEKIVLEKFLDEGCCLLPEE